MRSQTAKNYADADKADADYDLAKSQSKYYKTLEDYQDTQSMVAELMLPWQVEQMKQNIVNSAKVSDAQVVELLAGAGAHSAVAEEARERARGYRRDNNALDKVGDVGKFWWMNILPQRAKLCRVLCKIGIALLLWDVVPLAKVWCNVQFLYWMVR